MAEVNVFNMSGDKVGTLPLSDSVFGIEPNEVVMHAAVVNYLANQRQGTQSTLTRTEVRGGGRKPWRQKGTGHARQGSIRAPHWRHGGVALGPKPRSYRYTLNRKVRRLALLSALSSKVSSGDFLVIDEIKTGEYRTKTIVAFLKAMSVSGKAMIVLSDDDGRTVKSAANIPGIKTAGVNEINTYDILNHGKLIIAKDAVAKISEVYSD